MEPGSRFSWSLALGILIGFLLFFLSYWWAGSITMSLAIGLIGAVGVTVAREYQRKLLKREGGI
jgi:uncharacterized membrane protein